MKRDRILNPEICRSIAKLGHTEYMVIGDAGLPIPSEAMIIDVSVVRGVPSFYEVFKAVVEELVIDSFIFASEAVEKNPIFVSQIKKELHDVPYKEVCHEEFKELVKSAKVCIRTGECSSYANAILVGGVNF